MMKVLKIKRAQENKNIEENECGPCVSRCPHNCLSGEVPLAIWS